MNIKNIVNVSLCAALLFFGAFYVVSKYSSIHEETVKTVAEVDDGIQEETYYTVKKSEEKIGIFDVKRGDRIMLIETYVFTLPDSDKIMLEEGFEVKLSEITHIIEDYTG